MKKVLRVLLITLLVACGAVVAFYFWGQQPNFPESAHVLVRADSSRMEHGSVEDTFGESDSVFSVMTYNIGYLSGMTNNEAITRGQKLFDDNLEAAQALLGNLSPDIVCLQEIDYGSKRSYEVDQEKALADPVYPFVARAVNWDKRYVPFPYWPPSVHFGKIHSGQSVLSAFPITEHAVDTLAAVASAPFYYRAFYLDRLAQVVKLQVQGRTLVVINVHLEAFDRDTRALHTEAVLELFRQYSGQYPTLIMGDFNSSPDEANPTIDVLLAAQLNTVDLDNRLKLSYTYDSRNPASRLDYIFYNDSLQLVDGRVVSEAGEISDHLPVWASFRFRE